MFLDEGTIAMSWIVRRFPAACFIGLLVSVSLFRPQIAAAESAARFQSHPPLRQAPAPARRPLAQGPKYFVDAQRGDDAGPGTEQQPWRSLRHAIERLQAGDTLYLRGGTYYETVQVRLAGRPDAAITIASFPGEQAVLDGGLREFFESPEDAWTPFPEGAPAEYRSARRYPNLRHVIGSFGDSMIGLNAYYHAKDLRSQSELVAMAEDKKDILPLYCGPGVWYDPTTGHVHTRLAHTNLPGVDNYRGKTDPRKLPLVIAPFRSVPLHLDGAEYIRFLDLVIRGAGYETILIEQSSHIEFDNVTAWCGTYGLCGVGVRGLKLYRCGFYGSAPPWATRFEAGLRTYPGRTTRDITRLNTHALLIPDANKEFSVYAYPFNDDWEIAWCDFTDAGSDGLYLGGVNLRFHHNRVENMRDDGIYLSPMYPRHVYLRGGATVHLYQNIIARCLTALAFGGTEDTQDTIYFYRNVVDLRGPVPTGRPTPEKPQTCGSDTGKVTGDHGSPPWPSMMTYHNTVVAREAARSYEMWLSRGATKDRPRRFFNNILVHGAALPDLHLPDSPFAYLDGNLYWQPGLDAGRQTVYFNKYRASPAFAESQKAYPPGYEAVSLVADPKFVRGELDPASENDYRLQPDSPAADKGVDIPADWLDPLRGLDKGRPDIGALPLGAPEFKAGRGAAPAIE
jgi:hypothetical protein